MKKETRDPVWSLLTRFPKKLIPRSIATCARNLGVHIPCTTHKIVVGTRRMEMRNLTFKQPRKAQKTQSHKAVYCIIMQEDEQA
jgi:hypothetical protein